MESFHRANAELTIPDQTPLPTALSRTTHLGIGAHQDDLEFMAYHGILACFHRTDQWFTGVTCTDGHGSARTGPYADFTDNEVAAIRLQEQRTAAQIGEFAAMVQLGYTSAEVNNPADLRLGEDLAEILRATRPRIVYTHNPADKHRTHLGIFSSVVQAIRSLPMDERPITVWGCEVWRNLDWMPDQEKVVMNVSGRGNLAAALNGVFDSQIAGGKRYDLAVAGRRAANATFSDPHATDETDAVILGMDLTPLFRDDALDPIAFTLAHIERFADEVRAGLQAQFQS
jgi:LmbE family N-acetylglucosaminyl deacetylase